MGLIGKRGYIKGTSLWGTIVSFDGFIYGLAVLGDNNIVGHYYRDEFTVPRGRK